MNTAVMWEVRAEPDGFAALLEWVRETALPAVAGAPGLERTELFRSRDDRIVVITWWSGEPVALPEPPDGLAARPPHAWEFEPVRP